MGPCFRSGFKNVKKEVLSRVLKRSLRQILFEHKQMLIMRINRVPTGQNCIIRTWTNRRPQRPCLYRVFKIVLISLAKIDLDHGFRIKPCLNFLSIQLFLGSVCLMYGFWNLHYEFARISTVAYGLIVNRYFKVTIILLTA